MSNRSAARYPLHTDRAGILTAHRRLEMARSAHAYVQPHRSASLDAPPWLWTSIVDLVGAHEPAYLDPCRRFALEANRTAA